MLSECLSGRMEFTGDFTRKKLLALIFVIQGALLLVYISYIKAGGQLTAVLPEDTDSRNIMATPASLFRKSGFQNLSHVVDKLIKYPDTYHTPSVGHRISIAIGMGLTTRAKHPIKDVSQHIFFTVFLPSFCKTASQGYSYNFYIAFDYDDPLLSQAAQLELLSTAFRNQRHAACQRLTYVELNLIKCLHARKPAWAQNDAMMSAYMDNNDYYYRINDDTTMTSVNWTEKFIRTLSEYEPPNVGVVGPTHSGGNTAILTYDFVHRSHVDAFGFYYPRDFLDWHADRWITDVYKPGRITKLKDVKLKHTMSKGTRYHIHHFDKAKVGGVIERGKNALNRYIKAKEMELGHDKGRVIAMSVVGNNASVTYGAVRNILLQLVYFPTWTVRIYLEQSPNSSMDVPDNVVAKLKQLPAQIVFVNTTNVSLDPSLWPLLAVDDATVDYLLVRKPTSRLCDRDAAAVTDWLASGKVVHVIKDHPAHSSSEIVPSLWGARTKELRGILQVHIRDILVKSQNQSQFLDRVLWPLVSNYTLCHDSVTCSKNSNSFPVKRVNHEYLGQEVGPYGELTVDRVQDNPNCTTS